MSESSMRSAASISQMVIMELYISRMPWICMSFGVLCSCNKYLFDTLTRPTMQISLSEIGILVHSTQDTQLSNEARCTVERRGSQKCKWWKVCEVNLLSFTETFYSRFSLLRSVICQLIFLNRIFMT